jgi:hypothetical protein
LLLFGQGFNRALYFHQGHFHILDPKFSARQSCSVSTFGHSMQENQFHNTRVTLLFSGNILHGISSIT